MNSDEQMVREGKLPALVNLCWKRGRLALYFQVGFLWPQTSVGAAVGYLPGSEMTTANVQIAVAVLFVLAGAEWGRGGSR